MYMAMIVDDEMQQLKKRMQKVKLRIERAQAVIACQNLMDKYQIYHMRGMRTEETQLFALETPGGAVEMLWGIYDGPEGILRWKRSEGYGKPRAKGMLPLHCMVTPIIEIASDGQTAKGLWLMQGTETGKFPDEKEAKAFWAAGQFAMDFIKEDGEWKIWRYNTTGQVLSPFEKGWHIENKTTAQVKEDGIRALEDEGDHRPDRPASHPFMSNRGEFIEDIPPVPLPYETWDDSLACVPKPGYKWKL
jgi:hypothetical protein